MIKAIVIHSKPNWYCQRCKDTSEVLYINGRFRYCHRCVSEDIKSKAIYYNQNGEQIEYKE